MLNRLRFESELCAWPKLSRSKHLSCLRLTSAEACGPRQSACEREIRWKVDPRHPLWTSTNGFWEHEPWVCGRGSTRQRRCDPALPTIAQLRPRPTTRCSTQNNLPLQLGGQSKFL